VMQRWVPDRNARIGADAKGKDLRCCLVCLMR
jgi:hypothetical protein